MPVERNPFIIPDRPQVVGKVCPNCKKKNFSGRNVQGVITWTCLVEGCGHRWSGGLRSSSDPDQVPFVEPSNIVPMIEKDGTVTEFVIQEDPTPEFHQLDNYSED